MLRFLFSIFTFSLCASVYSQGPASWSSTQNYTHPTLVIDNYGVAYISLKYVTAGTLLSNTEYWVTLDSQVPDEAPSGADSLTAPDPSIVNDLDVPDSSSGKFQVIITETIGGSVSGAGSYNENETVEINAVADVGYQFWKWTDKQNVDFTKSKLTLLIDKNYEFDALFIQDTRDDDNDSLTNHDEAVIYNTLIDSNDTDGDGLNDGFEVSLGSDPTKSDHALIEHFYEKGYSDGQNTLAKDTLSALSTIADTYDLNVNISLESESSELSSVSLDEIRFFVEQLIDTTGSGDSNSTPYTTGWFYSRNQGWMWTSAEVFPYFFIGDIGWRYFKSGYDAPRFYDYKEKKWQEFEEESTVLSSTDGKSIVTKLGEIYKWEQDLSGAKFWILNEYSIGWTISSAQFLSSIVEWKSNPVTDNDFQIGDNLEFTMTSSTGYTVDDLGYLETNFSEKYQIKSIADGMIHVDFLLNETNQGPAYFFTDKEKAIEFYNSKIAESL